MSKWSMGVKISGFVISMAMIGAAYLYTDDLMAWFFSWMMGIVNGQMDQMLQGLMY